MFLIEQLANITISAGLVAIKYYNQSYDIKTKDDQTPVTEADFAVNNFIIAELKKLYPDIPILSEENSDAENLSATKSPKLFIIDPIDGTEAFIEKRPEFTINIGLVENSQFSLGFVYVPRIDILYYNDYQNAYKISGAAGNSPIKEILSKKSKKYDLKDRKNNLIITASHRLDEMEEVDLELKKLSIIPKKFVRLSSSYKFCLVAEKTADIYTRKKTMKLWDVAAAMAILKAADCVVIDSQQKEIDFSRMKNDLIMPVFTVFASKELVELIGN